MAALLASAVLQTAAPAASAAGTSPFTGRPLLTLQDTTAAAAASAAAARGDTVSARALRVLAALPQALWINGGTTAPTSVVAAGATALRTGRALVAVVYALPHRDCGGASAGGQSASGYRLLIRSL